MSIYQQMKLFSGTANLDLSTKIAADIGVPLCKSTIRRFADGEIFVEVQEKTPEARDMAKVKAALGKLK